MLPALRLESPMSHPPLAYRSSTAATAAALLTALFLCPSTTTASISLLGDVSSAGQPVDPLALPANTIDIGTNASGTLTLDANSFHAITTTALGLTTPAFGTLNLEQGSAWNTQSLNAAIQGSATINLSDAATITADTVTIAQANNANASINLNGAALWNANSLTAAVNGKTNINVQDNAVFRITADSVFAQNITSQATLKIDGTNASFEADNNNQTFLARQGTLNINIINDGTMRTSTAYLADATSGKANVIIDGTSSSWHNSNQIYIGQNGTATITLKNGATLFSNAAALGLAPTSNGTVNIQGPDASWDNTPALLRLAVRGTGNLNITHGATLRTKQANLAVHPGSTANLLIQGQNSTLDITDDYINIGLAGNANLTISQGATSEITFVTIAQKWTSTSVVTLQDTDTQADILNLLEIGQAGHGTLNIKTGAQLSAEKIKLGILPGSTGILNLNDQTSLIDASHIIVGQKGNAQLNITSATLNTAVLEAGPHGQINLNNAKINADAILPGTLEKITGTGTITTKATIYDQDTQLLLPADLQSSQTLPTGVQLNTNLQGQSFLLGAGFAAKNKTLTIGNGISITSSAGIAGSQSNASGTIKVTGSGSQWIITGSQEIRSGLSGLVLADNPGASGNLQVLDGATVQAADIFTALSENTKATLHINNATLQVTGELNLNGIGQSTLRLEPNAHVTIGNRLHLGDPSTLEWIISDTNTSAILASDTLLSGQLKVIFQNTSPMHLGDRITLIDSSNSLQGTFDNYQENQAIIFKDNLAIRITYQAGSDQQDVQLFTAPIPILGDVNADGLVNHADLMLIKKHLGTGSLLGDANHDNLADLGDMFAYRNLFIPTATAVPEPSTLLLLSVALLAISPRKKR